MAGLRLEKWGGYANGRWNSSPTSSVIIRIWDRNGITIKLDKNVRKVLIIFVHCYAVHELGIPIVQYNTVMSDAHRVDSSARTSYDP
jgi:hypothetical protein